MDQEKVILKARERYDNEVSLLDEEFRQYEDDLKFAINYDGAQWDDNVRRLRENDVTPRPCLVINKIMEKLNNTQAEFNDLEPSCKVSFYP